MLDKIITIYAIVDDLLKAIGHTEDIRCHMSDAEIITTALVGSIFFGGNHSQALSKQSLNLTGIQVSQGEEYFQM